MKIACLMPTYNRIPHKQDLIEEALHSFLLQDYENRELIICNDTPNQRLHFADEIFGDKVVIQNLDERFSTLSDKIQFMIDSSDADAFCPVKMVYDQTDGSWSYSLMAIGRV